MALDFLSEFEELEKHVIDGPDLMKYVIKEMRD